MVSINPQTGEILALRRRGPTRATSSTSRRRARQPGSTFKTIALATAIEHGIDPYSTRYVSAPFHHQSGRVHRDVGRRDGRRRLLGLGDAGERHDPAPTTPSSRSSRSTSGPRTSWTWPRRLGVKNATLDPFPSIALGGLTNGVSPLEMTSAYATLAAGGVYRRPHVIRR